MLAHSEVINNDYQVVHYIHRSNWIRAAVLGANDGILSTASIAIGVAAATGSRMAVVLAALAGVVAGALSMAAGEYVSVSSQTDIEHADIERERKEILERPEAELRKLAKVYEERGLSQQTAMQVAVELTQHDALAAHVRDELGITDTSKANPLQAALASGASFVFGGIFPLIVTMVAPLEYIEIGLYVFSVLFLGLLGSMAAKVGGSNVKKAIIRITLWSTVAMVLSALVGYFFGVEA
jgi:VIT1/CCC1 family predicted Fe2+/Mn2+ transporter